MILSFMPFLRVVRLGNVDKGRSNNLNLIRFLLASSVILSHSWVSMGLLASEPVRKELEFTDLGTIAVFGFFFISGYLILKSALGWSGPDDYLASRFLRIFPGLVMIVLLSVLVFGPMMTTLSVRDYFSSPLTLAFLSEIWMHRMQHFLPGVCTNYPLPWINASLWTLPGEWLMYVVTMVACLAFRWRSLKRLKPGAWIAIVAVILLTAQMLPLQWDFALQWFKYFLIGSVCYLIRDRVPIWIPGAIFLFAIVIFLIRHDLRGGHILFPFALCYLVITLGYHPAIYFRPFSRSGDYSYGLYIYGQPIQQSLLRHFHSPIPFFLACYPLILFVAVLSWHYLEEPALSLKHRSKRNRKDMEGLPSSSAPTR